MTEECHKNRSFLQKFKQIISFSLKKYKKPTKRHQNSHKKSLTALKEQKNTFDISSFVKRFLNSVQKNTKLKKSIQKYPTRHSYNIRFMESTIVLGLCSPGSSCIWRHFHFKCFDSRFEKFYKKNLKIYIRQ